MRKVNKKPNVLEESQPGTYNPYMTANMPTIINWASYLDSSTSHLRQVLKGKRRPSIDLAIKIQAAMGGPDKVKIEDILLSRVDSLAQPMNAKA